MTVKTSIFPKSDCKLKPQTMNEKLLIYHWIKPGDNNIDPKITVTMKIRFMYFNKWGLHLRHYFLFNIILLILY